MPHATQVQSQSWQPALTASLIDSLGRPEFPQALLHAIAGVVPADVCGAFRIGTGAGARATCLLTASRLDAAAARLSGERYAAGYWQHDPAFQAAGRTGATLLRLSWDAIRHTAFRTECYVTPQMIERMSIVSPGADGSRLLLSIFRRRSSGFFTENEAARWAQAAPVFAACVLKHAGLTERGTCSTDGVGLSGRERDVAARLAAGQTLKAIGMELGLALSTIETFRKRIYRKLGVASRVELLARLSRRH